MRAKHDLRHALNFTAPDTQHIAAMCRCGRWGAYITGYPLPWTWHLFYDHVMDQGCGCHIHQRTIFIQRHDSSVVFI